MSKVPQSIESDSIDIECDPIDCLAQANIDQMPDLAPPPSDTQTAELHGHHIANVTRQFAQGRRALPADYDAYAHQAPPDSARPASLADLMRDD